jgi:hypothetical protein
MEYEEIKVGDYVEILDEKKSQTKKRPNTQSKAFVMYVNKYDDIYVCLNIKMGTRNLFGLTCMKDKEPYGLKYVSDLDKTNQAYIQDVLNMNPNQEVLYCDRASLFLLSHSFKSIRITRKTKFLPQEDE